MRLHRYIGTAPRPSSVCFADTFPGGEGNPLRRGRADRVVRPYGVWRRTQGCTVSVGCCQTTIIKIACGAGRTAKNQSATQRSGCGLERKKEGANMQFSALAGNAMQRVSSDAMAARNAVPVLIVLFLFFTGRPHSFRSLFEKEKNGGKMINL